MKKTNYKERGITLVALVITIIILLILTGVTLNSALSDNGLFQKAKYAGEKYKESEEQEQSTLEGIVEEMEKISIDYNDYVGVYVDYKPTTGTCKIGTSTSGHTQEQTFTTEDINWRIWDYDRYSKTIRLISSKPTTAKLTLSNATGYNNGVWAVNEICRECYGTGERGVSVANLRRSDIQKISTYDYTKYKHLEDSVDENDSGTIYFGNSKDYTNTQYPAMWENFDSQWTYEYDGQNEIGSDKECETWERENGYKTENATNTENGIRFFKQSFYSHDYKGKESEFIKKEYYNLLFYNEIEESQVNSNYWLSGRYVLLFKNRCAFGLQTVYSNNSNCYVNGASLYDSNLGVASPSFGLRPIVSINLISSGYSLEKIEESGEIKFKLNKDN